MDKTYIFSGPGRTEISGNHTDHQHGCVLAGAVNLETTAEVRFNGTETIRVISEGYPKVEIDINDLYPRREEYNTTAALVRGIAAAFDKLGAELKGIAAPAFFQFINLLINFTGSIVQFIDSFFNFHNDSIHTVTIQINRLTHNIILLFKLYYCFKLKLRSGIYGYFFSGFFKFAILSMGEFNHFMKCFQY